MSEHKEVKFEELVKFVYTLEDPSSIIVPAVGGRQTYHLKGNPTGYIGAVSAFFGFVSGGIDANTKVKLTHIEIKRHLISHHNSFEFDLHVELPSIGENPNSARYPESKDAKIEFKGRLKISDLVDKLLK
ncbi:hypothetical protein HN419_03730 [Candidatus Woesearchaeota archaeon]|jgi:hypothetical protein|nr:hypothetical protein [Candidatus Woesearchaeota archaeon]MBT3538013.1 hypothetical protein [Candidatus Woesearchaeota archaeon]MBT4698104.1 hypothetical protein [Candidatus Woesearchaeota archaeon]MBT4717088.1 hypothetical protein [Candidatus Woesearchaeota archaeon]MBT7105682.1 hypothetical protein [Candidatus Woesearchaeota archaeon]